MGQFNRSGRNQKMYVEDAPDAEVYALDSVPSDRDRSWTNGVLAWQKQTPSEPAKIVGWFTPPRQRNVGHHNRMRPNPRRNNQ